MTGQGGYDNRIRAVSYAIDAVRTDLEGLLERTSARREGLLALDKSPSANAAGDWMAAVESYIESLLRKVPEAD